MNPKVIPFRREADDSEARERICHSLDESLMVEAAAGAGKTTVLIARLANLLESGRTTIDRVVAVTFTNKAAGEMRLRLQEELDSRLKSATGTNREHIEHALAHLEEATIGTIHSFCAQILRERPVEARVDPLFQELSAGESSRLYGQAFRRWFEERLAADSAVLRRALSRRASFEDGSASGGLRKAGWELIEWRDHDAPWMPIVWNRESEIDRVVELLLKEAAAVNKHEKFNGLRELALWIERYEAVQHRNYDLVEARLIDLRFRLQRDRAKLDRLEFELEKFRRAADQDLAQRLRLEMQSLTARYQEMKRKAGRLDFLDLLIRARDVVRENASVRTFFHNRFTHFLIDEFQDTDPLQAELFLLLSSDDPAEDDWKKVRPGAGRLFVVGDPKQSIYRFRRADVRLYEEVRLHLQQSGVALVTLSRSYRAVPAIQDFINSAFATEMTGDAGSAQAPYVPLERAAPPIDGQVSQVLLPVRGKPDETLPSTIASFVKWMLEKSGWNVREGQSLVPVRDRHICLLFRRMRRSWDAHDTSREYATELENRGIAHVLIGSKSFFEREEVLTLRAALAAIEWPDDTLSVYATLRGSLFSFSDEALFGYTTSGHRLHPFAPRPAATQESDAAQETMEIAQVLDLLADLHKHRNQRPAAATISLLAESVRAASVIATRPGGGQLLGNLARILDLARNFESSRGDSFRSFVESVEEQSQWTDSDDSPAVEEAADGVRIMSVHRAKGLEFPIVILCDTRTRLHHREPDRYVDPARRLCAIRLAGCMPAELADHREDELRRERAEAMRVAYVAATRARDVLVLPVAPEDWIAEPGGWLQAFDKVIRSVEHENYWARIAPEPPVRRRRIETAELLAADGRASESIAAYGDWQHRRARTLIQGAEPGIDIVLPSLLRGDPPHPVDVEILELPRDPARRSSRRFGALLHAGLRLADPGQAAAIVAVQGRILGTTEDETKAASEVVEAALAHPLLERARRSAQVLREAPLSYRLDDGRLLDGVVDLAFEEDGAWTVIDFKTGQAERREQYLTQLRWYCHAISRLTSLPARGVLLEL